MRPRSPSPACCWPPRSPSPPPGKARPLHLSGAELDAALREAAVVLVDGAAPDGDILAAMAAGTPWVSTPGPVPDGRAGGLVAAASDVPAAVAHLVGAAELGAAGRADWIARHAPRLAAGRLDLLLRGADTLPPVLAPAAALRTTAGAQSAFIDALVAAAPHTPAAVLR